MSYDPVSALWNWLSHLPRLLIDPASPFWWPTIVISLVAIIVLGLIGRYRFAEIRRQVMPVPPRRMFIRILADTPWFLLNSAIPFIAAPALLTISAFGSSLPGMALMVLGDPPQTSGKLDTPLAMVLAALVAFISGDLALYWTHRLFHSHSLLWRAHRLHHEPEILTPVTAFRFWPQEQVVHIIANTFMTGFGIGVVATAYGAPVDPLTLLGVNVFNLAWNLGFAHLRHSHVAMAFPRWLSHVLVSPHMHQAHHSSDKAQHNKNFATVFAFWDWIFGTLYLPAKEERFQFGVKDKELS